MRIVADNRGRIALGKLEKITLEKMGVYNLPGSEWEVEYKDCQLIVKPWRKEVKEEWVKATTLKPEHIGQVIWVEPETTFSVPYVPALGEYYTQRGVCGVLESFHTGDGSDVTKVRLRGGDVFEFPGYGEFWVKS